MELKPRQRTQPDAILTGFHASTTMASPPQPKSSKIVRVGKALQRRYHRFRNAISLTTSAEQTLSQDATPRTSHQSPSAPPPPAMDTGMIGNHSQAQFFSGARDVNVNNSVFQNVQGDFYQYNGDPDSIELNGLVYAHGAGYNTTKRCLDGTRLDVLAEIKEWACSTDPNVKPVFWLNGAAGTGKSAIAHTLAHWFNQRNALGSFLCFDRNYLAERRHEKVFSTIAHDLASQNPGVKQSLAAIIREKNWLKQTTDIIQQWRVYSSNLLLSFPLTIQSCLLLMPLMKVV
ncbi:hypothetical protein M413DRAFT_259443, partial [Hebeloma cylindrosporum]